MGDRTLDEANPLSATLRAVQDTMNRLWEPIEIVEKLQRIDGMSPVANKLYQHLIGALPILREAATELQAKLDEVAARRYTNPVSETPATSGRRR